MTIPDSVAANDIKVLLVLADDPSRTTLEIASQ